MSNDHATNSMTTKVEDRDLVLERIFDAPRELVFKVFKDPEHLSRWFGPKGWTLPVCKMDFRPGGVWHYCMRSADGQMNSWGKAVYHEIVEPERIVYTDTFSDEEGNAVEGMPETLITMTFVEYEGGKTKLISRAQFASPEALKATMDMGLIQGMTETWDNLAAHLKEIQTV
jgi:uncharacterized protein YndB with AHSA1/START domain